ncbi:MULTISPECIES: flagellar hook assembly protein FlgD [Gammaproteobacteria]|uniref:flagellar hook assembly protein FlgD n=1 Tax=Gammaproteobacteria TaxID=1236 RepID=UPI000DD074B0|nr:MULTISPECIES: flagellar hook assembly protein FlgD [Gammaproteobacteria]RTE86163.1 flagellar hook assembly protein FlgD [Aliidiomarina sp. B3213]TCZ91514.1 flagellar hook assembly protein FlgD [Lysobacter sp. N42]
MNNVSNAAVESLYWREQDTAQAANPNDQKLSQEDFFKLLTSQMAQQDPTKPVENDQMIAQMTNFTMAEGITQLTDEFRGFAESMTSNQALQASGLVGQKVLIPSDVAYFDGEKPVEGIVSLPQTGQDVTVRIKNEVGEVVHTVNMGQMPQGQHTFEWDGTLPDGSKAPNGDYVIEASGRMGEQAEALPALSYAFVESVSMGGAQGVVLNLESIGRVDLRDVIQITSGG